LRNATRAIVPVIPFGNPTRCAGKQGRVSERFDLCGKGFGPPEARPCPGSCQPLFCVLGPAARNARHRGTCCLIRECSRAGRALPHQNAPVATSECQSDSDMSREGFMSMAVTSSETASKPFAGRGRRGQGPKPASPVREAQPLRPSQSLSIIRLPSAGQSVEDQCPFH
jgi:hypothetical protein